MPSTHPLPEEPAEEISVAFTGALDSLRVGPGAATAVIRKVEGLLAARRFAKVKLDFRGLSSIDSASFREMAADIDVLRRATRLELVGPGPAMERLFELIQPPVWWEWGRELPPSDSLETPAAPLREPTTRRPSAPAKTPEVFVIDLDQEALYCQSEPSCLPFNPMAEPLSLRPMAEPLSLQSDHPRTSRPDPAGRSPTTATEAPPQPGTGSHDEEVEAAAEESETDEIEWPLPTGELDAIEESIETHRESPPKEARPGTALYDEQRFDEEKSEEHLPDTLFDDDPAYDESFYDRDLSYEEGDAAETTSFAEGSPADPHAANTQRTRPAVGAEPFSAAAADARWGQSSPCWSSGEGLFPLLQAQREEILKARLVDGILREEVLRARIAELERQCAEERRAAALRSAPCPAARSGPGRDRVARAHPQDTVALFLGSDPTRGALLRAIEASLAAGSQSGSPNFKALRPIARDLVALVERAPFAAIDLERAQAGLPPAAFVLYSAVLGTRLLAAAEAPRRRLERFALAALLEAHDRCARPRREQGAKGSTISARAKRTLARLASLDGPWVASRKSAEAETSESLEVLDLSCEVLRAVGPDRKGEPALVACRIFRGDVAPQTSAHLRRLFVRAFSTVFPGSWVRLQSGEIGLVLGPSPRKPSQPLVLSLYVQLGKALRMRSPRLVDTSIEADARVCGIVRRPDVSGPPARDRSQVIHGTRQRPEEWSL